MPRYELRDTSDNSLTYLEGTPPLDLMLSQAAGTYRAKAMSDEEATDIVVPTLTASIAEASLDVGDTATLTTNAPTGSTYQWELDGTPISGATSATYVTDTAGTLTCDVTTGPQSVTTAGVTVAAASSIPAFQALGTASGGSSAAPAWPAHQANDIGVLLVVRNGDVSEVATPSGWTDRGTYAPASPVNGDVITQVFTRVATGPSEAAPDCSGAGNTVAQICTVRGASSVAALGSGAAPAYVNTGETFTLPAGTTGGGSRLVMACVGTRRSSTVDPITAWTNSDLASVTDRGGGFYDHFNVIQYAHFMSGEKATAGAVGDTTSVLDIGASCSGVHLEFA